MYYEFNKDIITGKDGEETVINFFQNKNYKLIKKAPNKKFPDWDAVMENEKGEEIKLEIKTDIYPKDTGNLVIELSDNGKLCGIHTTKADKYCYYYKNFNELWICNVSWLKDTLKKEYEDGKLDIRNIGDNKQVRGWMLHRHEYEDNFDIYQFKK